MSCSHRYSATTFLPSSLQQQASNVLCSLVKNKFDDQGCRLRRHHWFHNLIYFSLDPGSLLTLKKSLVITPYTWLSTTHATPCSSAQWWRWCFTTQYYYIKRAVRGKAGYLLPCDWVCFRVSMKVWFMKLILQDWNGWHPRIDIAHKSMLGLRREEEEQPHCVKRDK